MNMLQMTLGEFQTRFGLADGGRIIHQDLIGLQCELNKGGKVGVEILDTRITITEVDAQNLGMSIWEREDRFPK